VKHVLTMFLLLLVLSATLSGSGRGFGGIQLLDGYSAKRESAIDVVAWTILGKCGLIIHFEAGPSEGFAASSADIEKYQWFRQQTLGRRKVLIALTKPGIKTDPDLDTERNLPPGNTLLVTFPLSSHRDHAANFVAKVANQEELVDVLLMTLTFDPSKGTF